MEFIFVLSDCRYADSVEIFELDLCHMKLSVYDRWGTLLSVRLNYCRKFGFVLIIGPLTLCLVTLLLLGASGRLCHRSRVFIDKLTSLATVLFSPSLASYGTL